MNELNHHFFMSQALILGQKAAEIDEVPVGALIVYENQIIATGYNRRNTDKCALAHAELDTIAIASTVLGDWRLEGCTLYVTIEPCIMCAGAIIQARITRVVFGAWNKKAGGAGSVVNILTNNMLNHQVDLISGVMEEECSSLMSDFFKRLRQ